jgi:hypothetical protein
MPDAVSDDEIAAVFERLREEVRRQPRSADAGPGTALPIRLAARQEAERLWPVTADRPLQRRAGPVELVLRPVRVVLRKLMRWYVEPPFADQREFNATLLELIDDLAERTSAGLARLERAIPGAAGIPEAGPYADDLAGAAPVLTADDPADVEAAAAASLGAVVFLAPDRAPSAEALARVVAAAHAALRPGGVLVAEAGGPVAPEDAARLAGDARFARADVRFGAGLHGYALIARR